MMSEGKKRRVRITALVGAVSGAVLATVLYFVVSANPVYFIFVPIAAALAAGQAYLMPE